MVGLWQILLISVICLIFCPIPAYWALKKMGFNGWGVLLLGIPFINLIFYGIIAYGKWPNANQDGDLVQKLHEPVKDPNK